MKVCAICGGKVELFGETKYRITWQCKKCNSFFEDYPAKDRKPIDVPVSQEDKLFEFIARNPNCTNEEMASFLNIERKEAITIRLKLEFKGKIFLSGDRIKDGKKADTYSLLHHGTKRNNREIRGT